jgi:hypothetical protein
MVSPRRSTGDIVPDPYGIRRRTQLRIAAIEEHRRACRELERLASLVEFYCGSDRRDRAVQHGRGGHASRPRELGPGS